MKRVEALETLELIGSDTYGLVTTHLASKSGVPRNWVSRLAQAGQVQRLRHGVYALPSAAQDQYTAVRGAWLSLTETSHHDPDQVIAASGATAALLYGVGNLVPSAYEFTSNSARLTRQPDIVLLQAPLRDTETQVRHGVLVTTPTRTVRDIVKAGIDGDHLGDVVKDFLNKGVGRRALSAGLDHGAHLYGAKTGRDLLQQLAPRQ